MRKRDAIASKEVARMVARRTRAPMRLVWPVVREFLTVVSELSDSGRPVNLHGVGILRWKKSSLSGRMKLRLDPAAALRIGRTMEKYGVVLDDEKTKQAGKGSNQGKCPVCGKDLDEGGACPDHGTEPMEKHPDGK